MELLLHVGGLILIALLLWFGGIIVLRKVKQLPPGPFPLPFVGNLQHVLGPAPHRSLGGLAKVYGPIMYLQLGCRPAVVVSSPKAAREFLQTHDRAFASRPYSGSAARLTYGGQKAVANRIYGAEWREMKKFYSLQLFTGKRVRELEPIRSREMKLMLQGLHEYAKANTPVDLSWCVGNLVENVMCLILLGQRLSEACDGAVNLMQLVRRTAALFQTPLVGDFIPCLSFLDCKAKRVMDECHSAFDNILEGILAKRQEIKAAHDDVPSNFLDVILSNDLGRDSVKAVIMELLAAGIDTSSVTVYWAMAELLANPQVLTKLQEELDAVVGSERMVEEADLPSLVYTQAVVKETFRKHHPAPLLLQHMSTQACTVLGYSLPEGTTLLVNAWAIGQDPQTWDDPQRFWPERFLGAACRELDVRGQHFELLPFGSGRRSCPGMSLALPIVRLTVSSLIHTFQWALPSDDHIIDMSENFGTVLGPRSPLRAIPSLRPGKSYRP